MQTASLLVLALGAANAENYWTGKCSICWPSNRGGQCGGDAPTNGERNCGFAGWGCEYECTRSSDTTAFWSGQCDLCWHTNKNKQCGGTYWPDGPQKGCGFLNAGCEYRCRRNCPNTVCSGGTLRGGYCGGRGNNYYCYTDPTFMSIADTPPPAREEFDVLGAPVPEQVASIVGDPHLALPHGGVADFRGEDKAFYNFLSGKDLSVNVMTQFANFELHPPNSTRHKKVHGSFLTEAHTVVRTSTGKMVRVSYYADKIGAKDIGWANGTIDDEPVFTLGPKVLKTVDDITLKMTYASLYVLTPEYEVIVTPYQFRLERNVVGLHHRLDVQFNLRVPEEKMAVAPHGIVGQAWDRDGKTVNGEQDVFPESGEFTTYAQAKGGIEGAADDYKMSSKYSTAFKYSRFDLTSAGPRDVAKLVATGELNTPIAGKMPEFVGSTERDFSKM